MIYPMEELLLALQTDVVSAFQEKGFEVISCECQSINVFDNFRFDFKIVGSDKLYVLLGNFYELHNEKFKKGDKWHIINLHLINKAKIVDWYTMCQSLNLEPTH